MIHFMRTIIGGRFSSRRFARRGGSDVPNHVRISPVRSRTPRLSVTPLTRLGSFHRRERSARARRALLDPGPCSGADDSAHHTPPAHAVAGREGASDSVGDVRKSTHITLATAARLDEDSRDGACVLDTATVAWPLAIQSARDDRTPATLAAPRDYRARPRLPR
jgi:hypothetical protein